MNRFWDRSPSQRRLRQTRQISRRSLRLESLEHRYVLDSTVVFNELMYNPSEDNGSDEWIELHNQLNADMDISDWRLDGGIEYQFPDGTTVPGRGFIVIAASPETLAGVVDGAEVLGPFSGSLSNGGEEVRLINNDERLMNSMEYGDGGKWPVGPDGSGVTLAKANELTASADFANWTGSAEIGGTPGAANFISGDGGERRLVINEITSAMGDVSVELKNVSTESVDLGGLILSATGETGGDYPFPPQTVPSGGFVVVSEADMGVDLIDNERLFLYTAGRGQLLDAQPITNRLRGRSAEYDGQWLYPNAATLGAENTFSFQSDIVINEIMYNAQPYLDSPETGQVFEASEEEWIELYNRGTSTVDLSGWELRDAVRYTFPLGTSLAPGSYLVVSNDAATLSQKYPGITIVGDFSGALGNVDDNIVLVDASSNPADAVHYYERGQWPASADAGGSSLELRNPSADNNTAGAWAASDESSKSEWTTFTVRRNSTEPMQFGTSYNEFIFGLLDGGEFLIDDIQVIENPNTTNVQVIQNGTFQNDSIGNSPSKWRLIGTHSGTVTTDPDDATNRVLHVVAAGPQQHVHDHAETTFAGNRAVRNGVTYEISFRAKWLRGSRQLNSRLYFNRASTTAILQSPMDNGTPGARNSSYVTNAGPTYSGMNHSPLIPSANQAVTVSIEANDPNDVTSMVLRWRRNSGGWNDVTMTDTGEGTYTGTIPGQSSSQVVQFYVVGTDRLGQSSTFPVRGEESRALFQVDPGRSTSRPIDTLHVIMRSNDNSQLFTSANRMSNNYVGGTLIRDGEEVFYDVQVRQIGSRYIRPNSGMKVKLNPEHLYFGVHDSVRLDLNGLDEIIFKQMVNRTGGSSVSLYDDVGYMVTERHGGSLVLLGLARYEDVFLKEQFEDGGDGTKFELDDITYPTDPNPSPEGLKTGTGVSPQDVRYRGSDLENYRGQLLIRNNRSKDDYEPLVEFARVINLTGSALANQVESVMDVDLWMRHYATQAYLGNWDTYGFRRPKNIRLYIRPDDGKVMPLYWDSDLANLTEPLIYNGGETRLDEIRNIPKYERLFWGHMWDLTNRGFNSEYAADWAAHYSTLGANATGRVSAISSRTSQARNQARSAIPVVPFQITTNNGNPISISDSLAVIEGNGWIDVREIRRTDNGELLDVEWTDDNSWRIQVPVGFGENRVSIEAFDFEGNSISRDSLVVTSTSTTRPLRELLRISEINYNPSGPDETEFIELTSIAESGPSLDLGGVRFTDGISFDFDTSAIDAIGPGERIVVVNDVAAFTAMYGAEIPIAGTFTGSLSNGGETIELLDAFDVAIHRFDYSDEWYDITDGVGFSLTTVNDRQDLELWSEKSGWRPSDVVGGTPGTDDSGYVPNSIVINEVSNNASGTNWIELHNSTSTPIDIGNWYLSDDAVLEKKFRFAAGTSIPAGGFLVVDETSTFGSAAAAMPFALSSAGGNLRLRSGDAEGSVTGYEQRQTYRASSPDRTHGLTGTSDGLAFTLLAGDTRGSTNSAPSIGPIVINEIMYNHAGDGVDFIEIKNLTNQPIPLGGSQSWHISDGIAFDFPSDAEIGPHSFVVIIEGSSDKPKQASEFRSTYDVPPNVPIYAYDTILAGSLDNGGERVTLGRLSPGVVEPVPIDSLRYNDKSPWPLSPDGTGPSLAKIVENTFADDPANWAPGSADGTPGRSNQFLDETPPSDPTDLVGAIVGDGRLALAWSPSFDVESGVSHYNVYQNGTLLGTSAVQFYLGPIEFESGGSATFTVSAVNSDRIESRLSNATTIGSQSVSFQHGVGGYTGAADAEMREGAPNQNNGLTDTSLEVDGEDGGSELAILMKWNDVTIPINAQVVGASITVNITNSGAVYDISQVRRGWNEGQVTWTRAETGQNWQTAGAKGANDSGPMVGELTGGRGGNTIDLNAAGVTMVNGWLRNPSINHGILIDNPGGATDGVDIDSREVGNSSNRPKLTIQYLSAGQNLTTGDYTLDGVIDQRDIATLCRAIAVGSADALYSLDGNDGPASPSDMDVLIRDILGTEYGDINLNGVVDTSDYLVWRNNRFETGRDWTSGDMNCDGVTDGSDFNLWNANRFIAAPAAAGLPRPPRAAGPMLETGPIGLVPPAEQQTPTPSPESPPFGLIVVGAASGNSISNPIGQFASRPRLQVGDMELFDRLVDTAFESDPFQREASSAESDSMQGQWTKGQWKRDRAHQSWRRGPVPSPFRSDDAARRDASGINAENPRADSGEGTSAEFSEIDALLAIW